MKDIIENLITILIVLYAIKITIEDIKKGLFTILVIIYIISPIDLLPGPIDDTIILLIGMGNLIK